MRRKGVIWRLVLAAFIVFSAVLVLASGALAKTIEVNPGESIQAAVDAADPGDTIVVKRGTYRESVDVTKSLTIQGAGRPTLLPPAEPPASVCAPDEPGLKGEPVFEAGFCVAGDVDFGTFTVNAFVEDVKIKGFVLRDFGSGILAVGARNAVFKSNWAFDTPEYGIFALLSRGITIQKNVTAGSHEAGIYVGDSPQANAVVKGNTSYDNALGIYFRAARKGTIHNNVVAENCLGILVDAEEAPAGELTIRGNLIGHNTRTCPPREEEEFPAISGLGVVLFGARAVTVARNDIVGNRPSGPSIFSAGIGVVSADGAAAPARNTVKRNLIRHNGIDILWDGSGKNNVFPGNDCRKSEPRRLC